MQPKLLFGMKITTSCYTDSLAKGPSLIYDTFLMTCNKTFEQKVKSNEHKFQFKNLDLINELYFIKYLYRITCRQQQALVLIILILDTG